MLPEQLRCELSSRLDARGRDRRLRWTPPRNWHVTLRFLGRWPDERRNDLVRALLWSREEAAFTLKLGTAGQFPARGALRVLFLQLADAGALTSLAVRIGSSVDALWPDHPGDRRWPRPHLTLARGAGERVRADEILDPDFPGDDLPDWPVEGFSLLVSEPSDRGVSYREEAFFPLRK